MDTTRIDLNLLLTLEALLAEQNVTKAAARLYLSQPAVSAQLNRLREIFQDPLLLPARRGMTPTVKALELIIPLREALDRLRSTVQSHQNFNPEQSTLTVTVACTDYIQAAVVMPLILALRKSAPGIRIAVQHYHPEQLEQQLANGEIDIAIATPPPGPSPLRTQTLFYETYVLIGRPGHPAVKPNISMEDFTQLEHIIVSPTGGAFSTPVDDMLALLGHRRQILVSAASFLFVPKMVLASDLVALVPRRLLDTNRDPLSVVDVPWLKESFEVSLLWHERSHGHAGHQWIRALISQVSQALSH